MRAEGSVQVPGRAAPIPVCYSQTVQAAAEVSHLALRGGRGHLAHVLLLLEVRGVLGQLVQDVSARRVGDVQVVGQRRAVGGRAGERVLLVGLL